MDESTWHKRTAPALMVAGFLYLVAYSWRVIADLSGPARIFVTAIVAVTWGMFIIDYLVRLFLAEHRSVWFRTHLASLAFALVPVLRLVRLLRVATLLPGMRSTEGDRLRTEIMVYSAGAAGILIYISSLAVLEVERHAPGATITTFGISIWWACVTVTTTGYGDYVPVTDIGRLVASGLMFGGIALAGIVTAALASLVVERAARNHDDHEPATRAQMRALMRQVEALTLAGGHHAGEGAPSGPTGLAPASEAATGDDALADAEDDALDAEDDAPGDAGGATAAGAGNGPDSGWGNGGDDRPGG